MVDIAGLYANNYQMRISLCVDQILNFSKATLAAKNSLQFFSLQLVILHFGVHIMVVENFTLKKNQMHCGAPYLWKAVHCNYLMDCFTGRFKLLFYFHLKEKIALAPLGVIDCKSCTWEGCRFSPPPPPPMFDADQIVWDASSLSLH